MAWSLAMGLLAVHEARTTLVYRPGIGVMYASDEDLVVQPTCETCKLPDLPWYLVALCALMNCAK